MYNGYNLSSDAGSPLSHTCSCRKNPSQSRHYIHTLAWKRLWVTFILQELCSPKRNWSAGRLLFFPLDPFFTFLFWGSKDNSRSLYTLSHIIIIWIHISGWLKVPLQKLLLSVFFLVYGDFIFLANPGFLQLNVYFLFLRASEILLFSNLQLFYWHFLEILWLFIFLVFYWC